MGRQVRQCFPQNSCPSSYSTVYSQIYSFFSAHVCNCSTGWQGDRCQDDVNECASSPCQNDGQCINVPGTYICVCTGYWVGQDCEIDEEECKKKPCHNNGTCVEAVGGAPSCICEPGKKQSVSDVIKI